MMNLSIKTIALSLLMVTGVASAADMFEQQEIKKVEHFQNLAFESKASKYTGYAQLFNLCQQKPKSDQCGEEYREAEQTYLTAKARSDVLVLLVKADNYKAPLPNTAYQELADVLHQTGYLVSSETTDEQQLLQAVNRWNQDNDFEQADRLLLIQLIMIQIDAAKV